MTVVTLFIFNRACKFCYDWKNSFPLNIYHSTGKAFFFFFFQISSSLCTTPNSPYFEKEGHRRIKN